MKEAINTLRLIFLSTAKLKAALIEIEERERTELLKPDFNPIGNTVGISCSPLGFGACLCWNYKAGRFTWIDVKPTYTSYFYKRRFYL